MAKKRVEPFNPWPGFVDLFASVIMVILMFMLVLIINISYYSQFRYKISYAGTVPVKQDVTEAIEPTASVIQTLSREKDTPSAGADYSNIKNDFTRQENIIFADWMVVKYLDNEVILDTKTIKDIEKFLINAKEKFPGHYVSIFIKEPQNQVSASVAKQLALSRILNIRNFIRKKDYKNDDVLVKLKENIPQKNLVEHESGYAVILINKKQ